MLKPHSDRQSTRLRAIELSRSDAALRRSTRLVVCGIKALKDGRCGDMPVESQPMQLRLARIAANIVKVCRLTGESPSQCMLRLGIMPGWRYALQHVTGPAGNRLRRLGEKTKKKRPNARRDSPARIARRKREAGEFERYLTEAQAMIDLGTPEDEAIATARAALDIRIKAMRADYAAAVQAQRKIETLDAADQHR